MFITETEHITETANTEPEPYLDPGTPRSVPIGRIVGGVVGGVAAAILLGFLIYQFLSVSFLFSLAVVINSKFL